MNRTETLEKASICVSTDRNRTYGEPEDSFHMVAAMWTSLLSGKLQRHVPVEPHEVAACLGALKLVRAVESPEHDDNWVDLAGYAACGAECVERCRKGKTVER